MLISLQCLRWSLEEVRAARVAQDALAHALGAKGLRHTRNLERLLYPLLDGCTGEGRGWQEREGAAHLVGVAGGGGASGQSVGDLAWWRGRGCGAEEAKRERTR